MPKMSKDRLAKYHKLDRGALDFKNEAITRFWERAMPQGYNPDYTGFLAHPGFFQAPHRKELGGVDIAIVGSPLDLGAIGLAGTRHGPQAVRQWSRNYGPIHEVTQQIPFDQCSIIDYGDVEWSAANLQTRVDDIYRTFKQLGEADCYTLNCGGEHTTAYGAIKGLSEAHDDEAFGLIHIDAHCDTMASWGGDTVNDGSVFRQAVLNGYIDPERTVQIGIRGRAGFLWDFSHDTGMTVITADELWAKGTQYVIDKAREVVGTDKTYLSFDVDSLDSGLMMGTTGPEPFGLTGRQVRDLILGARGLNIIGADMVELNPNRDADTGATHLASALFFELLSLLADCRVEQRGKLNPTNWK